MLKIIFRPWAANARNVPRRGAVILASNHLSFSDHFFGPLPLRRQVIFLAKAEYFTGRGLKGLISKAFFSAMGQIPVDRQGGAASEQAIQAGLGVLAEGKLLGIYPDGTRSPDGRLYRGKTGIARLALEGRAGDPVRDDRHVRVHAPGPDPAELRDPAGRAVRRAAGFLPLLRSGVRSPRAACGDRRGDAGDRGSSPARNMWTCTPSRPRRSWPRGRRNRSRAGLCRGPRPGRLPRPRKRRRKPVPKARPRRPGTGYGCGP
jgi:1-acyl-sn-glycerol-3-phosphate acyltransferase